MSFRPLASNVFSLALGPVNVFVIDHGTEATLIDTGYAHTAATLLAALQQFKPLHAITNIVVTHCHPDHAGGLAEIQAQTQAAVWMHRADAEVVRGNTPMVRSQPAPGLHNKLLYRFLIKPVAAEVPKAMVAHEVQDNEVLPLGDGLRVVHTPGHSAGHVALVLEGKQPLLFAADACSNLPLLGYSIVYDDLTEGRRSLQKLAALQPHTICFGHGRPLQGKGIQKFQRHWQ